MNKFPEKIKGCWSKGLLWHLRKNKPIKTWVNLTGSAVGAKRIIQSLMTIKLPRSNLTTTIKMMKKKKIYQNPQKC